MDVQQKATEARNYFERIKRGDDTIWTRKDSAPDWVQELTYTAHGDMGPDDWRYEFIVSALDMIAENGSEDVADYSEEIDSAVDVYTGELLRWLASNLARTSYVDEAVLDFGTHSDLGISGDIAVGQYQEREEVLALVLEFLTDLEDDDEADDEGDSAYFGLPDVNET